MYQALLYSRNEGDVQRTMFERKLDEIKKMHADNLLVDRYIGCKDLTFHFPNGAFLLQCMRQVGDAVSKNSTTC